MNSPLDKPPPIPSIGRLPTLPEDSWPHSPKMLSGTCLQVLKFLKQSLATRLAKGVHGKLLITIHIHDGQVTDSEYQITARTKHRWKE